MSALDPEFIVFDVETIPRPDLEEGKDLVWNAQVVAFGCAYLAENAPFSVVEVAPMDVFCCVDPAETVQRAWQCLKRVADKLAIRRSVLCLVGYNNVNFDGPVLRSNFDWLGLNPVPMREIDLMSGYNACAFHARTKAPKLKKLFERHKIDHLEGFDGGMIGAAWAQGEYDLIAEYQASDVRGTVELFKKVWGYFGRNTR